MTNFFSTLNKKQQEAVVHKDGPIIVFAGAGSGKTKVLTSRIAYLTLKHGVSLNNILAVTFTNKAAAEMKQRVANILNVNIDYLWISTFHSICLRILRKHADKLGYKNSFVIYDSLDSKNLVKKIIKDANIDPKKYSHDSIKSKIESAKNNGLTPDEFANEFNASYHQIYADAYNLYQQELAKANAMDFSDLLLNVVLLFKKHKSLLSEYQDQFKYILVDEFQDTNFIQYELLNLLSAKNKNIFLVGDDDQSIYGFRGALPTNISQFRKDYKDTKFIKLEQNYRSTKNILDAANSVIVKNSGRADKVLWTDFEPGQKIKYYAMMNDSDEANQITEIIKQALKTHSLKDICILYRVNAQTRAIEEALVREKVPYRIFGGLKFYQRKEVKDIMAYLRLVRSEEDNISFQRVINNPPRGIGAQTVNKIISNAGNNSLFQSCRDLSNDSSKLKAFINLINDFKEQSKKLDLHELISYIYKNSGYEDRLKKSKEEKADSRIDNIKELIGNTATFKVDPSDENSKLSQYLDQVNLAASNENIEDYKEQEYISLMTLHLAKGLEFKVVIMAGLEEGLLPHYLSIDDPSSLEEERRLCYVGITRAKKELYLTRAYRRSLFFKQGGFDYADLFKPESRFINDIPVSILERNDFLEQLDDIEINLGDIDLDLELDYGFKKKKKKKESGLGGIIQTADDLLNS